MDGQPVWLASVSVARDGRTVGAADLDDAARDLVKALLWEVMDGAGDESRQRLFRMNVTTCLHRAARADEVARVPAYFHTCEAVGLAGGPVAVLWETVPGKPSTKPCENPRRQIAIPSRPDLWIPGDCGDCEPCRARAAIPSYMGAAR